MQIIEILALFKAIKTTAKKYHWKTVGETFMSDHVLFDRIYNDIDDGLVDTIVEQYFMGAKRSSIDELDNLTQLCLQYEGKSFPANSSSILSMYQELKRMMETFLVNIEKVNGIRGINAELDNMASVITQLYGLVIARLSK